MLKDEEIKKILAKINAGTATEDEKSLFLQWYRSWDDTQTNVDTLGDVNTLHQSIWDKIEGKRKVRRWDSRRFVRIAAAFAIVAASSFAFFYYSSTNDKPLELSSAVKLGGDAFDHVTINTSVADFLDTSKYVNLKELDNGDKIGDISTGEAQFIKIQLPDGSKVSLNAGTKIHLADDFRTGQNRVVYLEGEAFFDVSKIAGRNFIVASKGQRVEVLGTKFNIKAYPNQKQIVTSLIEGSIRLQSGDAAEVLKPNDIAYNTAGNIAVKSEEVIPNIGWRQLNFEFDNEQVEEVLQQLGRWYGLKIVFKNRIPDLMISGKIPRGTELKDLQLILGNLTQAQYQLKDNVMQVKFNNN